MARIPLKIGLLNHLGGGNLGDDATFEAVKQNVKSRWPHAEIIGLSMNPSDTQKRHGIPSYAIRTTTWSLIPLRGDVTLAVDASPSSKVTVSFRDRVKFALRKHRFLLGVIKLLNLIAIRVPKEFLFLLKSLQMIRSFDLLVISGGGQLLDSWGGPWQFPYTIYKWVLLAKISRVKRVFLNVGAGPLNRRLSTFFIRQALSFADYISFRDEKSQTLIKQIGFSGGSKVVADCVYGLKIPAFAAGGPEKAGGSIVAISPMAYCHPGFYWKKDQRLYDSIIQKLAVLGSALIGSGHRLALFSSDICVDRQPIEDLKKAIENKIDSAHRGWVTEEPVNTTEQLLSKLSSVDYVVTCRFHGVVFAHLLNKPVIALSHHSKVATLMNDIGLSEYCVNMDDFDSDSLINKFTLLVGNAETVKPRMAETLVRYRTELAYQFDDLFPREFQ